MRCINASSPLPSTSQCVPFTYRSTANPDKYTVLSEIPGCGRLVKMTVKPGESDVDHEHPVHNMYFLTACKLEIWGPPGTDSIESGSKVLEVPAGAPPIFPAMKHRVKNVGDTTAEVLFIEAYPTCKPCGDIGKTPFDVAPTCYEKLADGDEWITGMMTMKPGESDPLHQHRDHFIYCLEASEVEISGFGGDPIKVPFEVGMAPPAPAKDPEGKPTPFFEHTLKNIGTTPVKLLFFERKF